MNAAWNFLKISLAHRSLQEGLSRMGSQKELLLLQGICQMNTVSYFSISLRRYKGKEVLPSKQCHQDKTICPGVMPLV